MFTHTYGTDRGTEYNIEQLTCQAQTQRFMKDTFIKKAFMKALTAQSMTLPYS